MIFAQIFVFALVAFGIGFMFGDLHGRNRRRAFEQDKERSNG